MTGGITTVIISWRRSAGTIEEIAEFRDEEPLNNGPGAGLRCHRKERAKMSKTIAKAITGVGCWLFFVSSTLAAELVIPSDVSITLNRELGRTHYRYQLDSSEARRIGNAFEAWVLQSLDFDGATRRQSERFGGRETFYQELDKNIPVFMYGRGLSGLPNTDPVPIIYRRSSNRFSFRKLLDVEAEGEVPESTAVEMAGSFLASNNFVKTTRSDMYDEITFGRLIQKHPPEGDLGEREVLILQQVRYRRKYLGAPVINSRISIDYHPDTLEVMGLKHYNWTPANEEAPVPIPRDEMKSRAEVEQGLRGKIEEFWTASERATLTSVAQAWFQTETKLIPILICQLEREPTTTGCGDVCTQFVNIAGSDLVFYATPKVAATIPAAFDCFPSTNANYADWRAMGSPSCWCAPYQCDGDVDGATETIVNYRVYGKDLAAVVENWKKKIDDPTLNPCADIDHKAETVLKFRVYGKDLATVVANWKKKDADLEGDCPRDE
jgi:hypothetical protein